MLYAAAVMKQPHTDNGPVSSGYDHEVVEELPEESSKGSSHRGRDVAGELPEELPRGLVERLEDLQRQLGHCEGRLELTRVVEAILRKQLKCESERAERLEEKLREAEAALYGAPRGWFKRFFGVGA